MSAYSLPPTGGAGLSRARRRASGRTYHPVGKIPTPARCPHSERHERNTKVAPWLDTAWPHKIHFFAGPYGGGKSCTVLRLSLAVKNPAWSAHPDRQRRPVPGQGTTLSAPLCRTVRPVLPRTGQPGALGQPRARRSRPRPGSGRPARTARPPEPSCLAARDVRRKPTPGPRASGPKSSLCRRPDGSLRVQVHD